MANPTEGEEQQFTVQEVYESCMFVHCPKCLEAGVDVQPLEIGLSKQHGMVFIGCADHGPIIAFPVNTNVLPDLVCDECGQGGPHSHHGGH